MTDMCDAPGTGTAAGPSTSTTPASATETETETETAIECEYELSTSHEGQEADDLQRESESHRNKLPVGLNPPAPFDAHALDRSIPDDVTPPKPPQSTSTTHAPASPSTANPTLNDNDNDGGSDSRDLETRLPLPFVAPSHYLRRRSTDNNAHGGGGVQQKDNRGLTIAASDDDGNRGSLLTIESRLKERKMSPMDSEQLEALVSACLFSRDCQILFSAAIATRHNQGWMGRGLLVLLKSGPDKQHCNVVY